MCCQNFEFTFKKELIQYQLIPTTGYSDLKLHYDKLDSEVTNIILIGCGAMLDLEGFSMSIQKSFR